MILHRLKPVSDVWRSRPAPLSGKAKGLGKNRARAPKPPPGVRVMARVEGTLIQSREPLDSGCEAKTRPITGEQPGSGRELTSGTDRVVVAMMRADSITAAERRTRGFAWFQERRGRAGHAARPTGVTRASSRGGTKRASNRSSGKGACGRRARELEAVLGKTRRTEFQRGLRKRSQGESYTGTKLETADTAKDTPTATAPQVHSTPTIHIMVNAEDRSDAGFPCTFQYSLLQDLPSVGDAPHYYYPGATRDGGRDGLTLEIRPDNAPPWLGTFAFGDILKSALSGVFSMPDRSRVCVVARGQGYTVRADQPTLWEPVQAAPITGVLPLPSKRLLVFATFTILVAYGEGGIKWRTKRLSSDGLQISSVTDSAIHGTCWDATVSAVKPFIVDLATGNHEGGANLPY